MPSPSQLVTFSLAALLLIAVPGPSVLFVISRSLALGRLAGILTVAGNSMGIYLQVIAVAIGIGAIVEESVAVFTVIKLAGTYYLIYLGIGALRHRRALADALEQGAAPKGARTIVRDGLVVGDTNPKGIVFLSAILPQFVNRSAGHVLLQLLVLGTMFITIGLLSDGLWAIAAGTLRAWLSRSPRRLELLGGVGGLVMIGIGARLALSGRAA